MQSKLPVRFNHTGLFVAIGYSILGFLALPASFAQSSGLNPAYLCVEYLVNPLGIDQVHPRLSWIVESGVRGARQTAYRILVSSSESLLEADSGDLWDTGKVFSSQTAQIVYSGTPLVSRMHCYWKVRVWDEEDTPSAWSPSAHWSMGLLNPEDWQGSWIGLDAPEHPQGQVLTFDGASWIWHAGEDSPPAGTRYFRSLITIPTGTVILRAQWAVTVDDQFTSWINGVQVTQSDGNPDAWSRPQVVDINNLTVGANVLAVEGINTALGPAGVLGKLIVTPASGSLLVYVTDSSWKGSAQLDSGWNSTGFDDNHWAPVKVWGAYPMPPWYGIPLKPSALTITKPKTAPNDAVRIPGGTWRSIPVRDAEKTAEPEKAQAPYLPPPAHLRRFFTVSKSLRRATLFITALGLYEARLNGSRIGDALLAPGWTSYNIRLHYNTYDVTSLLAPGNNTLGVILADGWYSGYTGLGGREFYGAHPRLRAQLEMEYTDSTSEVIATDGTWKGAAGPYQYADLLNGAYYDARNELTGWDTPFHNDFNWQSVDVTPAIATQLMAHPGPPIRKITEFTPVSITEPVAGKYIFNFGQNFSGFVRLRVTGASGTAIVLRHGETLYADGTLNADNLRSAASTDTYVCKGGGEEIWEPQFTTHGFQYVEMSGYPGVPNATALTGIAIGSDTPVTGSFDCSNSLVNQLYNNIYWSQRMNFMDIPTDCPQRDERLGWLGDAQIFIRTSAFNADVASFFTKWIYDVNDSRYPSGAYRDFAPHFAAQGGGNGAWADAGVIVPWTLYHVYGDTAILDRWYNNMVEYMDYCEAGSNNYIRPAVGYGDWAHPAVDTPQEVISTAYFAYSASLMAEAAGVLGRASDETRFSNLFNNIREAFNTAFVDGQGHVHGQTQTAYILALRFNLLSEPQRAQAIGHLVNSIQARGNHLATGFVGTRDLMMTLTLAGRTDVAYDLLLQDTYPSWGFLIGLGATTTWEYWNDYHLQSHAHYVYGCVGEWIYKTIGGIDTIGPGFSRLRIQPEPGGGLTRARASYDSIRGTVSTDWEIQGDHFNLDLTLPPNTTAEVHIPSCNPPRIWESGLPISQVPGVTFLRMEGNTAVYDAVSGSYRFTSRIDNCAQPDTLSGLATW